MSDTPERIWVERDPETSEKRWFSIKGVGVEYVRADLAALRAGGEPYAYEFGGSNGDGTFSVHIERTLPAKPHPDWPVRNLYTHPATSCERELAEARAERDAWKDATKKYEKTVDRLIAERDALASDKARLEERGQAFANQVRAVINRLNGQAYSSTLSALNWFDAALASTPAPADKAEARREGE